MAISVARNANENWKDYLFHYTSVNGLMGIVKDGFLRATHHRYLNDKSELKYGFREFSRIAAAVLDEQLADPNSRIRKLAERGFIYSDTGEAWASIVEHFVTSALGCYLFCLCAHSNRANFQHGLLSQWRGYGADGGYAIRFRKDRLDEYLSQVQGSIGVKLEPVIYGINSKTRTISAELRRSMTNKLVEWCEHPLDHKESANITDFIDLAHVGEVLDYVVFTKNEHFAEECEWRLCAIRNSSEANHTEKYFARGGTIVPYVEVCGKISINECIDQVIVGPHAEQDERVHSTHSFLRSHGCEALVVPTDIPLRPN